VDDREEEPSETRQQTPVQGMARPWREVSRKMSKNISCESFVNWRANIVELFLFKIKNK